VKTAHLIFGISTLAFALAPSEARAAACTPGVQVECACPGGSKGAQVCSDNGSRFLPCQCATPGPAPAPAQTVPAPVAAAPSSQSSAPVAPPNPQMATLRVNADQPAMVVLDGETKGITPLEVRDLASGNYQLRVVLKDGTDHEEQVQLAVGETRRVFVTTSRGPHGRAAGVAVRLGLEGGGGLWINATDGDPGGGPIVGAFSNVALSSVVEFRVGARVGFGVVGNNWGAMGSLTAPANFRFKLGPTYTMMVGTNIGAVLANGDVAPYVGAEASVLTFRFGNEGQFEIGVVGGVGAVVPAVERSVQVGSPGTYTTLHHTFGAFAYSNAAFSILF
jgi:hypothetical protein